jgi:uracil-DNA glycosylase
LDAQVVLVDPKLIIILGNVPLYSVCDIPPSGITRHHGVCRLSREWSDGKKRLVFPMFHPGYCLRGSGLKEVKEDALGLRFFVQQHLSKSLVELYDFAGKKLYLEEQGGL